MRIMGGEDAKRGGSKERGVVIYSLVTGEAFQMV